MPRELDRTPRRYDWYYMSIAESVAQRAKCSRRKVGAIIVHEDRIIATGFNGTPSGMRNCEDGGCDRCENGENYRAGRDYDLCLCIHAEENCILMAAKSGSRLHDGSVYTTVQPCLQCLKHLYQAGVTRIVYRDPFMPPDSHQDIYNHMLDQFYDVTELHGSQQGVLR